MSTDDDDKPPSKGASSGDAPKKKKKRPADDAGTKAAPKKSVSDASARAKAEPEDEAEGDDALVVRGGEGTALDPEGDAGGEQAAAREIGGPDAEATEEDEEAAATQLGTAKYVLAGFFAAGIVGGYVLGRVIHGVWATLSNKDFFTRALPQLAAVQDDTKSSIGTVIGGLIALVVAIRTYRRPDVRAWTDEVASELTKVKWPTKKDVTNSTMVVIAASTVATIYLALLDRLWAFVTNLVYGTGT